VTVTPLRGSKETLSVLAVQAAEREMREETGLDTRVVRLDARRLANVNTPGDLVALPR